MKCYLGVSYIVSISLIGSLYQKAKMRVCAATALRSMSLAIKLHIDFNQLHQGFTHGSFNAVLALETVEPNHQ
jgi:hypothetical protein